MGNVTLRYVGNNHYRTVSKADWASVDLDHPAIRVCGPNARLQGDNITKDSVEVSEEVAAFLAETEGADWELVPDGDAKPKKLGAKSLMTEQEKQLVDGGANSDAPTSTPAPTGGTPSV